MPRRVEITLKFSADIDEVPGWGHEKEHWVNYVDQMLSGNKHYNPSIHILNSEIVGEKSMLGLLLELNGKT